MQEQYGLDPAHYLTSPGLSWDALLKSTRVELELLTDYEMHLFMERGMRGGICMASKRYAKANNQYVGGYDPGKPKKFIAYEDANNLYGWAMSKPLPMRDFKWKRVMPTEEEILAKKEENARNGWILEVDLEYPPELHAEHNCYPLAPEKMEVKSEWMSSYQKSLIEDLGLKPPRSKKLMLTLKGQRGVRCALREPEVLSEDGDEAEEGPQGAGVRTRMLDGALHQEEHGVQEKGGERL